MANLWFLKSGEKQSGDPVVKSLDWCIDNLELNPSQRFEKVEGSPLLIGEKEDPHKAPALGLRFAIVQLFPEDVKGGWKTGFYLLEKNATEVRKILGIY